MGRAGIVQFEVCSIILFAILTTIMIQLSCNQVVKNFKLIILILSAHLL